MVSNTLGMDLQHLLEALKRFRVELAEDPEYQELRKAFPPDWPL
jgi:hypothetical protein